MLKCEFIGNILVGILVCDEDFIEEILIGLFDLFFLRGGI